MFKPSGGLWLFGCSVIYMIIGMLDIFVFHNGFNIFIQLGWLCAIALPLFVPPLARYLNMYSIWGDTMWRKREIADKVNKDNKIVPFPAPKAVDSPMVPPPEKDPTTYYSIGHTDDNRVTLRMGYTTLTMNYAGVQNLIDQLELYQSQLRAE